MRYELTSNTVLFAGITLYQIRALEDIGNTKKGELGGYISLSSKINLTGKGWIKKNSFIIDSILDGDIRLDEDVIIWSSYIQGKMWFSNGTRIKNSNLTNWRGCGSTAKNTIIINKDIKFESGLDNRITNSGYFRQFYAGKALVLCGNEYVKCGCKTFSYQHAYNLLKSGKIAIGLEAHGLIDEMNLWFNNRETLLQECEKELKRLGIKYKEGDK